MSVIVERGYWAAGFTGLCAFLETPWFRAGIGSRTYFSRVEG